MNLFQSGTFTLNSGHTSSWKVECDALTLSDWETLATIAHQELGLPEFGKVVGIPRGGIALGRSMEKYITPNCDRVLICDDVWTTGGSMTRMRQEQWSDSDGLKTISGLVAFARGPIDVDWVKAIWTLT